MTPEIVSAALASPVVRTLAKVLLTFPYWMTAIHKAVFFKPGCAEMEFLGFKPGAAYSLVTIALCAICSGMIIADYYGPCAL